MKYLSAFVITISLLISNTVSAKPITIDHAYVRATPPHAKNSAAFMTISNNSETSIKLIGASSDIAQRVELHSHTMDDGLMKMRQVKNIVIQANNQIILQPGGYHIMFLGLKQKLQDGESVKLKLHFDNEQMITLTLPIEKIKTAPH